MDIRQALAQGGPVVLGDKTFNVAALTQGIKGLWSQWCIENAWRRTMAWIANLPPDIADREMEKTAAQVNSGRYEYYGDLSIAAQKTFDGFVHLLWLRFKPNHPQLKKEELEELLVANDGAVLQAVMKQVQALDADPTNAKRIQE